MQGQEINLRALERNAWRSTYEDGLLEIFLGAILAITGVAAWIDAPAIRYLLMATLVAGFVAGKRLVALPRVGTATFGRERRRRQARVRALVAALVVPPVVLVVALLMAGELAAVIAQRQVLVGLGFGGVSLMVFSLMAHWLDIPRLYYVAVVYAAAFPLAEWLDTPVVLIGAGLLIIVPGAVLLERFVRRNPPAAANHDHG